MTVDLYPVAKEKKVRGYETLTHTFIKGIGGKTNENKKNISYLKIYPTPLPMEMLIKNQNKSNGRLCDTNKKLEQGSIINETKINKVKVNVPLINII